MSFFSTVEFYVILAVVAAAIVALAARPESLAPVKEILLGCELKEEDEPMPPMVRMECMGNGIIRLTRTGVAGLGANGAVSLAIKIKGQDMSIEERLTPGRGLIMPSASASCSFPFVRLERYRVVYNSGSAGLFAAFTFPAKPGAAVERPLHA